MIRLYNIKMTSKGNQDWKKKSALEDTDKEEQGSPTKGGSNGTASPTSTTSMSDSKIQETKKYIKIYAWAKAESWLYLPKWESPLGRAANYLKWISDGTIKAPRRHEVFDVKLDYAPSDQVLFEMLKKAKADATRHWELSNEDLGFSLGFMQDT